ncbi:MAG: carboxylating nicotinate-nucleotide diphosphorylase [Gammaproteobacteria bacterium]|nr:carboxylating nicotinate-nucleotide diphosphorylase [Gammaproteobacteria bacterium]
MDFKQDLKKQVSFALAEDIGSGDITATLIPENTLAHATVITRESAILCGQDWFNESFLQVDPNIKIHWNMNDGTAINADDILCTLTGNARSLLTSERTALNFLQTLSATATRAHEYAQNIIDLDTRILDTRKTIPGLRLAQKYAVQCGGCSNHRIGLFDAILIKENHIIAAGSISNAIGIAKKTNSDKLIEVEVETLEQLSEAQAAGADRILLDNMNNEMLQKAVKLNNQQTELEASGGITLENIREIAETGVDYISIGALTKDILSIDLSLRLNFN